MPRRTDYTPNSVKLKPTLVKLRRTSVTPWHEILTSDKYHTTSLCGVTMDNGDIVEKTRAQVRNLKKPKRCQSCKGVLARQGLQEPRPTEEVQLPEEE